MEAYRLDAQQQSADALLRQRPEGAEARLGLGLGSGLGSELGSGSTRAYEDSLSAHEEAKIAAANAKQDHEVLNNPTHTIRDMDWDHP